MEDEVIQQETAVETSEGVNEGVKEGVKKESNNSEVTIEDVTDKPQIDLPEDQEQAQEVLKTKGFDYAELQKEFIETGNISETTRSDLAKVGITGELVDSFIEGQKAKAEQERNELASCVGGRRKFDSIIQWAAKNLSESEITSINSVTDKDIIQIILKDLKARMEEQEGITPNYTNGEGGKISKEIYRSQAEMFEAISNPKYGKDEAYRHDVQQKITASREAGIDLGI